MMMVGKALSTCPKELYNHQDRPPLDAKVMVDNHIHRCITNTAWKHPALGVPNSLTSIHSASRNAPKNTYAYVALAGNNWQQWEMEFLHITDLMTPCSYDPLLLCPPIATSSIIPPWISLTPCPPLESRRIHLTAVLQQSPCSIFS